MGSPISDTRTFLKDFAKELFSLYELFFRDIDRTRIGKVDVVTAVNKSMPVSVHYIIGNTGLTREFDGIHEERDRYVFVATPVYCERKYVILKRGKERIVRRGIGLTTNRIKRNKVHFVEFSPWYEPHNSYPSVAQCVRVEMASPGSIDRRIHRYWDFFDYPHLTLQNCLDKNVLPELVDRLDYVKKTLRHQRGSKNKEFPTLESVAEHLCRFYS